MIYTIYFCTTCKSIYTDSPEASKVLGWPVKQKDGNCKLCGEFLEVEEPEQLNPLYLQDTRGTGGN